MRRYTLHYYVALTTTTGYIIPSIKSLIYSKERISCTHLSVVVTYLIMGSSFNVIIFVTLTKRHVFWDHTSGAGVISSGMMIDFPTVPRMVEEGIGN